MLNRMKKFINDGNDVFYKTILKENDNPNSRNLINIIGALLILIFSGVR